MLMLLFAVVHRIDRNLISIWYVNVNFILKVNRGTLYPIELNGIFLLIVEYVNDNYWDFAHQLIDNFSPNVSELLLQGSVYLIILFHVPVHFFWQNMKIHTCTHCDITHLVSGKLISWSTLSWWLLCYAWYDQRWGGALRELLFRLSQNRECFVNPKRNSNVDWQILINKETGRKRHIIAN